MRTSAATIPRPWADLVNAIAAETDHTADFTGFLAWLKRATETPPFDVDPIADALDGVQLVGLYLLVSHAFDRAEGTVP